VALSKESSDGGSTPPASTKRWQKADLQFGEGRLFFRLVETKGSRTGEGRRAISEEEGDARERVSPSPRRKGQSPGWASPLPNVLRSLGYPATNSPRGKAQAGDSPRLHHRKEFEPNRKLFRQIPLFLSGLDKIPTYLLLRGAFAAIIDMTLYRK